MRVWLTGGSGMLGRAIIRLAARNTPELDIVAPSRAELDLTDRSAVAKWLADNPVDAVIHAAAKVGGIQANIDDPSGFLSENLRINDAVVNGAYHAGIRNLIYLGSSCMYPRDYRQPLVEEDVLAAPLEPSNEGYALAKITGARLCTYLSQRNGISFRTIIPPNLFGGEDHFGSASSHLLAAAITKVVDAQNANERRVEIWGSGKARREFLDVDHLAQFILTALPRLDQLPDLLNVGAGEDHSIDEYYHMVAHAADWTGSFDHNLDRPEGMRVKLMSSEKARALGYQPPDKTSLQQSIALAVAAYRKQIGTPVPS